MSNSKTKSALKVSKIVQSELTDEQKTVLERVVRDAISKRAKTSDTISQTAAGALNSKTDVVYDTVHVLYDLSSLPFSREGFVEYLKESHGFPESDAEILAIQANIPSKADSLFASKVEEPRSFPQPFIIQEVVLASKGLSSDPYRPETVRRVIEGFDDLNLIGRGNYGANTAVGLPKHTTIIVKPELRKIFEDAVFEAQRSTPPKPPRSGRLEKLTAALAFTVAMIAANVADAGQEFTAAGIGGVLQDCNAGPSYGANVVGSDLSVHTDLAMQVLQSLERQRSMFGATQEPVRTGEVDWRASMIETMQEWSWDYDSAAESNLAVFQTYDETSLESGNSVLGLAQTDMSGFLHFMGADGVLGMHRRLLDDAEDTTKLTMSSWTDTGQLATWANPSYWLNACDLVKGTNTHINASHDEFEFLEFVGASSVSGMHRRLLDDASEIPSNYLEQLGAMNAADNWITIASADSVSTLHQGLWADAMSVGVLQ